MRALCVHACPFGQDAAIDPMATASAWGTTALARRDRSAGPPCTLEVGSEAAEMFIGQRADCRKAARRPQVRGCSEMAERQRRDPGSNRGPSDFQSDALPAELSRPLQMSAHARVGLTPLDVGCHLLRLVPIASARSRSTSQAEPRVFCQRRPPLRHLCQARMPRLR